MRRPPMRAIAFALLLALSLTAGAEPPRLDRYGDALPDNAVARLGTVRLRHGGQVECAVFISDGKELMSFGGDSTIRVWEVPSGNQLASVTIDLQPGASKRSAALSPDGRLLAITYLVEHGGAAHGLVVTYDTRMGRQTQRLTVADNGALDSVGFSPNGKLLAAADRNSFIHIWEIAGGEKKHQLRLTSEYGTAPAIAFSPNSDRIAALTTHNMRSKYPFKVWSLADGALLADLRDPLVGPEDETSFPCIDYVPFVAFTPDGNAVVAPTKGCTARLWDIATQRPVRDFSPTKRNSEGIPSAPAPLTFSRDARTLFGTDRNGQVFSWDVASGKCTRTIKTHLGLGSYGKSVLALSPNGNVLALAQAKNAIQLWNLDAGKEVGPQAAMHSAIASIEPSSEAPIVAVAEDGLVELWDFAEHRLIARHERECGPLSCLYKPQIVFSPNGQTLALSNSRGIHFIDPRTGRGQVVQKDENGSSIPRKMVFTPDGRSLAIIDFADLKILKSATGKLERTHELDHRCHSLGFSQDGAHAVLAVDRVQYSRGPGSVGVQFGDNEGFLQLWRFPFGDKQPLWSIETAEIDSVCMTPNGRMIAYSAPFSKIVRLVETATTETRREFSSSGQCRFSRDGRFLAFGDATNDVVLWDLAARKEAHRFRGHLGPVTAVDFSADGKHLISGSSDTTALVWDLAGVAPRRRQSATVPVERLESLWADLESTSAADAHTSICTLASASESTTAFLRSRLRPVIHDPRRVQAWIADLGSARFSIRATATNELELLGPLVAPALRQALSRANELELRRRLEQLLQSAEQPVPPLSVIRLVRAVEVLENIGTAEAVTLLRELAAGAKDARLTQECAATLRRLEGNSSP